MYRKKLLGLFFEEGEYGAVDILPGEGGARVRERARHAPRLQQISQARLCLLQRFKLRNSVVDLDPHPDPDSHHFGNLYPHPDPHPHQIKIMIRIRIRRRIKEISWTRNRILIRTNLQMTTQNVWNMSLFEHFIKV
jgi:hypothetical protein